MAVATKDVFAALGLRNGELLVGSADVLQAMVWPEAGASLEEWVEAFAASSNDLEAPAMRIQPVIGEVISALNATNGAWLARMSGSGATCFAIYENTAEASRGSGKDSPRSPGVVGACGRAELVVPFRCQSAISMRSRQAERHHLLQRGLHRRSRKQRQRIDRHRAVMLGAVDGVLERAVLGHQADGMIEIAVADLAALQRLDARMRARRRCRGGTPAPPAA